MNKEFLDSNIKVFLQYKKLAEKAIEQLEPAQLFIQPNEDSNSIAVVVKHMAGNMMSRWTDFLTRDGEKPNRNRDSEFENDLKDKELLLKRWEQGWNVFMDTLTALKPEDLHKKVYIRGEAHLVLEALNRQMAHYSYHVGQIVYAAKLLKKQDWNSLSIPKNKSDDFNREKFGKGS